MDIELDQGPVTDAAEAVDLTGLDDEDVTRSGFEFLSVDGPETAPLSHELDFIVRMTMGPGTTPGKGAEEKYGDIHIAVIGPDELVRAPLKGQVLLTHAVHPADAPVEGVVGQSGKWTPAQDTTGPANSGSPERRDEVAELSNLLTACGRGAPTVLAALAG